MKSFSSIIIAVAAAFVQFAVADYICNGNVTNSVAGNVIVSGPGTTCTINGATINGEIRVSDGANLNLYGDSRVNNIIKLNGSGSIEIFSETASIPISKIEDVDSVGTFHMCGATVSGGIKSTGRIGDVAIGYLSCADTISYGPISFTGGEGRTAINGVKNHLSSFTATQRKGSVSARFPNAVSTVLISDVSSSDVQHSTVFSKLSVSNVETSSYVGDCKILGSKVLENISGYCCNANNEVSGVVKLSGNNGVGLFNSKLTSIDCENLNESPVNGYKVKVKNTTFNSAGGECAGLQSGVESTV